MKILNREKTHFMHPNAEGTFNVKFGKVSEVRQLINAILDGKPDPNSNSHLRTVDPEHLGKTK